MARFVLLVLLWIAVRIAGGTDPDAPQTRHIDNPMGLLIDDEVRRAESDLTAVRTRAQGVLAVSGALVTVFAGLLALAVGKTPQLELTRFSVCAAAVTLVAFMSATVLVLSIFLSRNAKGPNAANLLAYAENRWGEPGWDKDVAESLAKYLVSLRKVNRAQARRLAWAIGLQVLGILGAAIMALGLLSQLNER